MSSHVLLHLSDLHLRSGPGDAPSVRAAERAVAAVLDLARPPAAVVVTGDLADTGSVAEYARLAELLAPIAAPVYPVVGNCDHRDRLLAALPVPGGETDGDTGLQYTRRVGDRLLIVCDTRAAGGHWGELGPARLAWLGEQLEDGAVLALHHPPVLTGVAHVDRMGLRDVDRVGLERLLTEAVGVHVIAGHLHRPLATTVGRATVWVGASIVPWGREPADDSWLAGAREQPGLAVHAWSPGARIVTHARAI